jgi:hypothetical protein
MSIRSQSRLAWIVLIAPLIAVPSACTVDPGYGYGPGPAVGIGLDYYGPLGYDYGGWGPQYRVGPTRGGARFDGGGRGSNHTYRSASPSRGMPSIPSGPRGGGGRAGGGSRR